METCCYCCTVRVGSLVIGTLGWVGCLGNLIYSITGLVKAKVEHDPDNSNSTQFQQNLFTGIMVGACVGLLINVLLVVGVQKKRKIFMLPWIVVFCAGCVLISIGVCLQIFAIFTDMGRLGTMIAQTLLLLLYCILSWYCYVCVYSHYVQLKVAQALATSGIVQFTQVKDNETPEYKDNVTPV